MKIKLKVGKREVELTKEEARALKEELDGIFESKEIQSVAYPIYIPPIVIREPAPTPNPGWPPLTPWCGTTAGISNIPQSTSGTQLYRARN